MSSAGISARASILGSVERGFIVAAFSDWLILGDLVLKLLSEDL